MKPSRLAVVSALAALLLSQSAAGQSIRVHDDRAVRCGPPSARSADPFGAAARSGLGDRLTVVPVAWHGQPVPTGGTLCPYAFVMPATVNASSRIAFMSKVDGALKNQGIFAADETGLYPLVMGCGGGGGSGDPGPACGDPSPIGGTFTGFFGGTMYVPAINNHGDVLFLGDVYQGSSYRGLFLYRAATDDIVKVAAVGDPSPLGGAFGAVGPGSLNDSRQVVFIAQEGATDSVNYLLWESGTVSVVAAVGDPTPAGGTFKILGSEWHSLPDGTKMCGGPVPAVNNHGEIAFKAFVSGSGGGMIFFYSETTKKAYLRQGDPTPAGGTYSGFWAPQLVDDGRIAFLGNYSLGEDRSSAAWFTGRPGNWRKALGFDDPVDGGACCGLAVSRNPMRALDSEGNLFQWANVRFDGGTEKEFLLVSEPDGHLRIVARAGDPTPLGGAYGDLQPWPSMNDTHVVLSADTPGAWPVQSAHFLASGCPVWQDYGHSLAGAYWAPHLHGEGELTPGSPGGLHLGCALADAPGYLFVGFSPAYLPFYGGTLVPAVDLSPIPFVTDPGGSFSLTWSSWPPGIPSGLGFFVHGWIVDPAGPAGASASNALKGTVP